VKPGLKLALVAVALVVAAAPFWVALTIPFESFEVPPSSVKPSAATTQEILADLAKWDAATTAARRAAAEDVARRLPDFALLRLETFACGGQTHEVAVYRHAKTEMEFVLVPAGTFVMGADAEDDSSNYAASRRSVTLTSPFLIARTDCTQEAFRSLDVELPGLEFRVGPPAWVRWTDAKTFCDKAGLALPTEAQWEHACRAGTTTTWSFGDAKPLLADYAWYAANSSGPRCSVGEKKPNAFGLYDMHGNVWQWCEDSPGGDSPDAKRSRVLRGGSCMEAATRTRSADRFWFTYGEHLVDDHAGFRPAKTVPAE
jgi:formylglycine-generating enzyme required for sulfatase activity